ncbi:MAG: type II toxin-antitoxin system VapC family toxin [Caulobacter sp.]|nr:type II toxin-antitoxin system VapC family toxin [Caulobacter sp.]
MTCLVVDASVAIKWVYSEDESDLAAALLIHELRAPDLLTSECANILWKKTLRGDLDFDAALRSTVALQRAAVTLVPMPRLSLLALELAIRLGHPAYDCFYLALAALDDHPFATADLSLVRKLRAAKFREAEVMTLAEAAALPA